MRIFIIGQKIKKGMDFHKLCFPNRGQNSILFAVIVLLVFSGKRKDAYMIYTEKKIGNRRKETHSGKVGM